MFLFYQGVVNKVGIVCLKQTVAKNDGIARILITGIFKPGILIMAVFDIGHFWTLFWVVLVDILENERSLFGKADGLYFGKRTVFIG